MTLDPDIITHDELNPPRIVYVPRRIDTPEQAAALPKGTVVIGTRAGVIEKGGRDLWWSGLTQVPDRTPIGGTALVPAEVYEGPGGHGPSWYIQADEYDR